MKKLLFITLSIIFLPSISQAAFHNGLGFETGSVFEETNGVTGTASIVSSTTKNGDYSFRVSPTGTATGYYIQTRFSVASTTTGNNRGSAMGGLLDGLAPYISFYFRHDLLPTTQQETILELLNTSFALKARLTLNDDGKISLRDSTNVGIATSTTALSAATWYRIDVFIGTGAAASYELKINEVSEASGTANFTTGSTRQIRVGKVTNLNGNSMNMYYDDMLIGDSEFGPSGYKFLRCDVDGDGTYTQWTGGTGSSNYLELDETPSDDGTTYVQSTGNNDIQTVTYESASACGVSGTIIGVMATETVAEATSGTDAFQAIFLSNTAQATTTSRTDLVASFLRTTGFWFNVDPATMTTWTNGGIDEIQFGGIEAPPSAVRIRISAPHIQVVFVPDAGGGEASPPPITSWLSGLLNISGIMNISN